MFKTESRYSTKRAAEELSEELQRLIWNIVDSFTSDRQQDEIEYLQYFELSRVERNGQASQRIVHRQEYPAFMEDTIYEVDYPIEAAIIVYDEIGRVILMFAEEY